MLLLLLVVLFAAGVAGDEKPCTTCEEFASESGILVRVIECLKSTTTKTEWMAPLSSIADCVGDQVSSVYEERASMLLRHDLPYTNLEEEMADWFTSFGLAFKQSTFDRVRCYRVQDGWTGRNSNTLTRPPCRLSPNKLAAELISKRKFLCQMNGNRLLPLRLESELHFDRSLSCCADNASHTIDAQLALANLSKGLAGCQKLPFLHNQIDLTWATADLQALVFFSTNKDAPAHRSTKLAVARRIHRILHQLINLGAGDAAAGLDFVTLSPTDARTFRCDCLDPPAIS